MSATFTADVNCVVVLDSLFQEDSATFRDRLFFLSLVPLIFCHSLLPHTDVKNYLSSVIYGLVTNTDVSACLS